MTIIMYTQEQIMELVRQHAMRTQNVELVEGNHSVFYSRSNGSLTISMAVTGDVTAENIQIARPEIDAEVERNVTGDTVRATVTGNAPSLDTYVRSTEAEFDIDLDARPNIVDTSEEQNVNIGIPDVDSDFVVSPAGGESEVESRRSQHMQAVELHFGVDRGNAARRVSSDTVRVLMNEDSLLSALENYEREHTDSDDERIVTTRPIINYEEIPEGFRTEVTNYYDIVRLMEWAMENQQLVKIVYTKRNRSNERSARIITPLAYESPYLRTHLHCTLVEGGDGLHFSDPNDTYRSFITDLIERAELFGL